MKTFNSWLDDIVIKGYQIGVIGAGNANSGDRSTPRTLDNSLNKLLELLEQGYDRVEWVGNYRDMKGDGVKEPCPYCKDLDSSKTTWDLASFLNMTKESDFFGGIDIIAVDYNQMSDDEKLKVINNPYTAYKYAKSHNFVDIPEEVVDTISEDIGWTESYIQGFLRNNSEGEVPSKMVSLIMNNLTTELDFIMNILHYFKESDNIPERFIKVRRDEGTELSLLEEKPKYVGEPNLHHNAPIYEHSHVGCKCWLAVYKSDNPSDIIFVDVSGEV